MLITASIGGFGSDDNNFLNFCVAFSWSSSLRLYRCLRSSSLMLDQSVDVFGTADYKHKLYIFLNNLFVHDVLIILFNSEKKN